MLEVRPERVELLDGKKGSRAVLVKDRTRQACNVDMSLSASQQQDSAESLPETFQDASRPMEWPESA